MNAMKDIKFQIYGDRAEIGPLGQDSAANLGMYFLRKIHQRKYWRLPAPLNETFFYRGSLLVIGSE